MDQDQMRRFSEAREAEYRREHVKALEEGMQQPEDCPL